MRILGISLLVLLPLLGLPLSAVPCSCYHKGECRVRYPFGVLLPRAAGPLLCQASQCGTETTALLYHTTQRLVQCHIGNRCNFD